MECLLPLSSFLTGTDCGIVADDIGINTIVTHLLKHPQCLISLSSLLTSTDGGTVAGDIGLNAIVLHLLKQLQ